ncbi:PilW family protein [Massilia sp. erpn]|uniref:PilW family protein n=1 Tax=Massilia sp. erpn TaxID=2738142 RepID=UPI0021064799|nr:PilW family protein [Massilia sp. erpn]UTY59173.1 pilus assembly protein PilW [Massilia sp. erpn]
MRAPTTIRRAGGFSMIELMVSVVIGMLAVMFATRLFIQGEQNKSAAVGGSDTMQNGMLALFSINNDASQAGWGLNDALIAGCDTRLSDTSGFTLAQSARNGVPTTPLAPVVIQSNGLNSDQITLYSGSSMSGVGSVKVRQDYNAGNTIGVSDTAPFGFNQNDVIVVTPEPAGGQCSIAQLSAAPAASTFTFTAGGSNRFNGAGLPTTYKAGQARVFNLGQAARLSFHTWSVQNGMLLLRATDLAGTSAAPSAVIDHVVAIKAQYGLDTRVGDLFTPTTGMQVGVWSNDMMDADGDGIIGSAGDFQRIAAIRVAVVARSKMPEKADPKTGECSATTETPKIFSTKSPATVAAQEITVTLALAGDPLSWKCYRYRVFETIVPIRNAGWRP